METTLATLNCTGDMVSNGTLPICKDDTHNKQKGALMYVCIVLSFYSLPVMCLLCMLFRRRTKGKILDDQVEKYFSGLDGLRKQDMVEKIISTNLYVPGNYMCERFAARRGSLRHGARKLKSKTRLKDENLEWEESSLASETPSRSTLHFPKSSIGSLSNFSVTTDTGSEYMIESDLELDLQRPRPVNLQQVVVYMNAKKASGQLSLPGDTSLTPVMERRRARLQNARRKRRIPSVGLPVTQLDTNLGPESIHRKPTTYKPTDSLLHPNYDDLSGGYGTDIDVKDVRIPPSVARQLLSNRDLIPDTPRRSRRGGSVKPPEILPIDELEL